MLAAQLLCSKPSPVLFQNANDLFFTETASLDRLSPKLENRLTKISGHFRGASHFVSVATDPPMDNFLSAPFVSILALRANTVLVKHARPAFSLNYSLAVTSPELFDRISAHV
jgi:hypothetical protein